MRLRGVSMRWWLALAFALIASLTAVAVAEVFTERAEDAFRSRAEELTTGNSVAAASEVARGLRQDKLDAAVNDVAQRRRLALFVFAENGTLLTSTRSRAVSFGSAGLHEQALERALAGNRFVGSTGDGRTIAVGLPLRTPGADALVAVASRPDLVASLGILRGEIVEAALWAVLIGALAGLLVAILISVRLRRIARKLPSPHILLASFDLPPSTSYSRMRPIIYGRPCSRARKGSAKSNRRSRPRGRRCSASMRSPPS